MVARLPQIFQLAARCLALGARALWLLPAATLAYRAKAGAGAGKGADRPLLVIYSQVAWQGVWQRPQELAVGLAQTRRTLYVSPIQAHETLDRYPNWRRNQPHGHGGNLTVFAPLIFPGHYRWGIVYRINQRLIRAELRWLLRREPAIEFFTNTPLAEYLIPALKPARVFYDAMDDFAAFDWAPAGAADSERRLLERADAVLTGTRSILDKIKPRRADAVFIACGVDYQAFQPPEKPEMDPEPGDIQGLPRPILGYIGTISERIDTGIISALAERFPQASIVLIGPVYRTFGTPPRAPNVHYLGMKPHASLAAYLRRFDVGLMPFRLTPAAMAINPVKALEYMAAGCPVISTAIPDVKRFYSEVARIASSPEEFVAMAAQALDGGNRERIERGRALARGSSWERMVGEMRKIIEKE